MKEIPRVSTLVSDTLILIGVFTVIIGVLLSIRYPPVIKACDSEKISPTCVEGFLSITIAEKPTPVFIESEGIYVPIVCK